MSSSLFILLSLSRLLWCMPNNPVLWNRVACSNTDLAISAQNMRGMNGIYWGWALEDGILAINKWTNRNASTNNIFSPITSPDAYYGVEFFPVLQDTAFSHAVMIASVMPIGLTFAQVDTNIAEDIAGIMRNITSQGVEVWLRFGHEMNYYVATGLYHGSASEFINAWQTVHAAVKDIPGVLMFWSPNWATLAELTPWWPDPDTVDIVGMDVYTNPGATFAGVFDKFYNAFAKQYSKHMVLGETSVMHGSITDKENWVTQLANMDLSAYPCFKSVTWFEYDMSGDDFRIIMGQSQDIVADTMANFV